jgi:hypothetical protein
MHNVRKAFLVLDGQSRTHETFKRHKAGGLLYLVFTVVGCDLSRTIRPAVTLEPAEDLSPLPQGAVRFSPSADTDELEIFLDVDPDKFDPGTYGGLVRVHDPSLIRTRALITVSRSESRVWLPILIALVGALVGVLSLVIPSAVGGKLAISNVQFIAVVAFAVIAGVIAAFPSYWNQEVWTLDDNGWATAAAAFAAATAGSIAVLIRGSR